MSAFAPWAITLALVLGGVYLAFEGAEKVYEFLYHATGLCGEGHPSMITVGVLVSVVWCAVKFGKPVLARFTRNEGTIRG